MMKKLLLIALISMSSPAFADTEISGDALGIEFTGSAFRLKGKAAEVLYNSLSQTKDSVMATGTDASWSYRNGKSVRCDKVVRPGLATLYFCETGEIGADGSIKNPAEG